MINIVIPMAGEGSRFSIAGFNSPKPLIAVGNKSMIEVVINNIKPCREHRFIFICQRKHLLETNIEKILSESCHQAVIISLENKTQGAAETVLAAESYINNEQPLMIANCDQWVDIDINHYLDHFDSSNAQGMIMSMTADDPKWSYMKLNDTGLVTEVKEKQVISQEASVGIYNFKKGQDFCQAALKMIQKQEMSRGEFYVAPVYNSLMEKHDFKVITYNVGSEFGGMYGLGIPTDLDKFINSDICSKAIDF